MNCPKCNNSNRNIAIYCKHCGESEELQNNKEREMENEKIKNNVDNLVDFYANDGFISLEVAQQGAQALEERLSRCGYNSEKLRQKTIKDISELSFEPSKKYD